MSNTNMINPANYYNPFAKYNYVSKTRGVYIPRDTKPLLSNTDASLKSASIYSENYDAETDIMQSMDSFEKSSVTRNGLIGFIHKFFDSPQS